MGKKNVVIGGDYQGSTVANSLGNVFISKGFFGIIEISKTTVESYDILDKDAHILSLKFKDGKNSLIEVDDKVYSKILGMLFKPSASPTPPPEEKEVEKTPKDNPEPLLEKEQQKAALTEPAQSLAATTPKKKGGCFKVLIFLVLLVLGGAMFFGKSNKKTDDPQSTSVAEKKVEKITPAEKTLGMTLKEFDQNYKKESKKMGLTSYFALPDSVEISKGDVYNSFTVSFTKNLVIQGTIEKSGGKLISIVLIAQPQNSDEATELFITFAQVIQTFQPEFGVNERGALIRNLGLTDTATLERALKDGQYEKKIAIEGRVYFVQYFKELGFFCGVETE